jgi:hypothetical protein
VTDRICEKASLLDDVISGLRLLNGCHSVMPSLGKTVSAAISLPVSVALCMPKLFNIASKVHGFNATDVAGAEYNSLVELGALSCSIQDIIDSCNNEDPTTFSGRELKQLAETFGVGKDVAYQAIADRFAIAVQAAMSARELTAIETKVIRLGDKPVLSKAILGELYDMTVSQNCKTFKQKWCVVTSLANLDRKFIGPTSYVAAHSANIALCARLAVHILICQGISASLPTGVTRTAAVLHSTTLCKDCWVCWVLRYHAIIIS